MLVCVRDEEIYLRCFKEFVEDRSISMKSTADVRCAIKVYTNHIMNTLADLYDVDQDENEGDVPENRCGRCLWAHLDENRKLHCIEHEWMDVDKYDGCSDWQERCE